MKIFENLQPSMMSVNAQAIWNEKRGYWEVTVISITCEKIYPNEEYSVSQSVDTVFVEDCDEAVIADALLHLNGINVEAMVGALEGSIIKGEE